MGDAGRVEKRYRNKTKKPPTRNQPTPKIYAGLISTPKPGDKLDFYMVSPGKPVDLGVVAARLAESFGCNVWVYDNLFDNFDVYLERGVEYRDIFAATMEAIK